MYNQEIITRGITNSGGSTNAVDGIALMFEAVAAFMVAILIGLILAYAIYAIVLGKIFKKAGIKPSIAWIPVYNTWKLLEMGDQKGFWALFTFFFPPITTVFTYIAMYHIGKKFGKEDWFFALAILVAPVWLGILAFDKSVWNGAEASVANQMPTAPSSTAVPEENNPNIHSAAQANIVQPVVPIIAPVQTQPEYMAPETPAPTLAAEPAYTAPETPTPMTEDQPHVSPESPVPLEAAEPVYTLPETLAPLEQPYVAPEAPIAPGYSEPQAPEAPSEPINPNIQ